MRKLKQKIEALWQSLTIRKKIGTFTGMVFLIIFLSMIFDVWVVKFSLTDFNRILEENSTSSNLVQALEKESKLFERYMRTPEKETRKELDEAIAETRRAVKDLPFDYSLIGEERYAKTWSIQNSYEVYQEKRDAILDMEDNQADYIRQLYEVYDMQEYLQDYARILMTKTLEGGSIVYREKVPGLVRVLLIVVLVGMILLYGIMELAKLMNKTIISPVMELVRAAKKIAANDFFVKDVNVWNQDELGELVGAFNKMKYATGEYILALEEKRKTLDLLHEGELEKLEAEKRLKSMHLELLKSQINPHFLFNTLNVIGGMANLEDAVITEKMIKALSSLFRYNLKTPEEEVPLAKELKVVKDYMYLQQMRFGSRIAYQVTCSVDQEKVLVPTFTFQPLVENAIIHGLSPKEEGGKIRIRIWQSEEMLYIVIGDTGVGMDEEKLRNLREELQKKDGKTGIGLGNIYKRIYAMYQGSSVNVYSRKNAGTVIKIRIPQNK